MFEEAVDGLAVQSLPAAPPPEHTADPPSQIEAATQTESNDAIHSHNSHDMKDATERENKIRAQRETRSRRRDTEQRLLAMADILAAHSDVVTDSGSALSRRLNELARDVLEANQIICRREQEVADLNNQLSAMRMRFTHAHAGLFKAQALVGDIVDSGLAQIHRHRTVSTMEQALQGIRVVLGDGKVDEWEREKVDGILAACTPSSTSRPVCPACYTRLQKSQGQRLKWHLGISLS